MSAVVNLIRAKRNLVDSCGEPDIPCSTDHTGSDWHQNKDRKVLHGSLRGGEENRLFAISCWKTMGFECMHATLRASNNELRKFFDLFSKYQGVQLRIHDHRVLSILISTRVTVQYAEHTLLICKYIKICVLSLPL